MENFGHVKINIENILKKIRALNGDVKLLGVTKNFPVEAVEAAIASGLTEFGESKVQEAEEKIKAIALKYKGIRFHFIGHLQTNKVNKVAGQFDVIQSVDSARLAEKISESVKKQGKEQEVLLEIKVSGEETKFGIRPEDAPAVIDAIRVFSNIKVKGLMVMAPYSENPENARPYFKTARKLFDGLRKAGEPMQVLSMGMTDDYIVAIEEGSTMVRIGTGIFGKR